VLTGGYVIAALGLLGAAATAAAAGGGLSIGDLYPTLLVAGIGQGLGMSPLVGTIIAGLSPADAGAGAGVVTTTLQMGNVLGVALGGLLLFTLVGGDQSAASYATAFGEALPVCAALLLVAALLVHRLPLAPLQAQNALMERLPGWASGFGYSMFLMTGGRVGDRLFADTLSHVAARRIQRTQDAPDALPDFLVYHFDEAAADRAWLNYLLREALSDTGGPVAHEAERRPVLAAQVEEITRRQADGRIPPELDPALFRLLVFALTNYPRLLPQITRMTTGRDPSDPEFVAEWERFLRQLAARLET
jgi:hypothetical protein